MRDGGPTTYLSIAVYPPEGDPYRAQASRSGNNWQFDLELAQEGTYSLWVNASDLAGNTSTAGPFEVSAEAMRETYLPSVMSGFSSGPDLVIQHILVTEDNIQVTLANIGNMPVDNAFWVDVYINPEPLPTAVNQRWDQLCEQGLAWGVTDVSSLTPGGRLTLKLNDPSFLAEYSSFSGKFSPEMAIYGQVDSYADTPYGGVLELQEKDGGTYNNILGPVFPLPIQLGENKSAAVPSPANTDPVKLLPERAPEAR